MRQIIYIISFLLLSVNSFAQTVYKTPSGEKYHTATCRYVKNVSTAMDISEARSRGLSACKQCNPRQNTSTSSYSNERLGIKSNEAQGTEKAVQCNGRTKAGKRCSRMTRNKNGYCFQHEK